MVCDQMLVYYLSNLITLYLFISIFVIRIILYDFYMLREYKIKNNTFSVFELLYSS